MGRRDYQVLPGPYLRWTQSWVSTHRTCNHNIIRFISEIFTVPQLRALRDLFAAS